MNIKLFQAIPFWVKALVLLVIIGVLSYKIYDAGVASERKAWEIKTAKQEIATRAEIADKNSKLRALERQLSDQAIQIHNYHQGVLNDKLAQKDRVIADLRAGIKRLSIHVVQPITTCQDGGSGATGDRPSVTQTSRAELSESAAEFLIGFATEADTVVIESNAVKDQLALCRATLKKQSVILKE